LNENTVGNFKNFNILNETFESNILDNLNKINTNIQNNTNKNNKNLVGKDDINKKQNNKFNNEDNFVEKEYDQKNAFNLAKDIKTNLVDKVN